VGERVPIDFMGGQFIVLDGFERVRRRRVVKVIRGCGGALASWTSNKKAPVGVLVGDGFRPPVRPGQAPLEVDGVNLGGMYHRAEELIDLAGARVYREDEIIASTGLGLSTNARMSMLRGALQGEPSRAGWRHALAVLEAWPHDQGLDDALCYAADLTRGWPADLCVSSRRWIKRSRQVSAPRMRLAKAVVVRQGDALRDVARALDGAPRCEALTFLSHGVHTFPLALLRGVLAHDAARRVHTITLRFSTWWSLRASFHAALLEADLPALEQIRVDPRLNRFAFFDQGQALALLAREPPVTFTDLEGAPVWRDAFLDEYRASLLEEGGEGA
jgi:hypothetical protein